ncbi:MAG: hypothetical protein KDE25_04275 [Novosphingobium sp.]|nr:hypothetical protein [Novosphingobium sp.]
MNDTIELTVKFRREFKEATLRPDGAKSLSELFSGIQEANLVAVYAKGRIGKVELQRSAAEDVLSRIRRFCIASEVIPAMTLQR